MFSQWQTIFQVIDINMRLRLPSKVGRLFHGVKDLGDEGMYQWSLGCGIFEQQGVAPDLGRSII